MLEDGGLWGKLITPVDKENFLNVMNYNELQCEVGVHTDLAFTCYS